MKRNRPIEHEDNEGNEDEDEGDKNVINDDEEEEEEDNGDDDSEYEDNSSSDDDDDDDDDDTRRTLLFLCEEGQIEKALKRVRKWDELYPPIASADTNDDDNTNTRMLIKKELFRKNNRTGNYCLHEILAGGICGERSAPELVHRLLQRYKNDDDHHHHNSYRNEARNTIFSAQPRDSHGRTVLHWCAWSKVPIDILKQVIVMNPECMLLQDHPTHGSRTPHDISKRYWGINDTNTILLHSLLHDSYLPYRIQYHVQLCINRIFTLSPASTSTSTSAAKISKTKSKTATKPRTTAEAAEALNVSSSPPPAGVAVVVPFNQKDRKRMKLKPKIWFVASVIAYTKQRSMDTIASHIVSYMGYGSSSKIKTTKNKKSKSTIRTNKNKNKNKNKRARKN